MRRFALSVRGGLLLAGLILLAGGTLAWTFQDDLRIAYARWRYPHIVLVTFDTLNVDFIGPFNSEVESTPNLDSLAREGVLYRRAYTTVPITVPSHASLLTGRAPEELGVMVNGDVLQDEVVTLPEILSRSGYRTAAFTSLGVLKGSFNLDQGFDHYDDDFLRRYRRWYRTADEVVAAATEWIRESVPDPFFVWLHLSDPHEPYVVADPPPDNRLKLDDKILAETNLTSKERHTVSVTLPPGRHQLTWTSLRRRRPDDSQTFLRLRIRSAEALRPWLRDPQTDLGKAQVLLRPITLELDNRSGEDVELALEFDGWLDSPPRSEVLEQYRLEVAHADRALGELRRFMAGLGLDQRTLWLLVSDHGEGLYRKSILGHAGFVQEDQLRVLWLLKGPGVRAGRTVDDGAVLMQDVLPTLLDVLRLRSPAEVTGFSQVDCWRGAGCRRRDEWWAYGASAESNAITAVAGYRGPWKLLWQKEPGSGCYNLAEDPAEQVNLGRPPGSPIDDLPQDLQRLIHQIWDERDRFDDRLARRQGMLAGEEELEMLRSLGYLGN